MGHVVGIERNISFRRRWSIGQGYGCDQLQVDTPNGASWQHPTLCVVEGCHVCLLSFCCVPVARPH